VLGSRGRRRTAAAVALLAAVAVVVAIVAGAGSSSPGSGGGNSADSSGATAVQRRDLVETDTESGTLGYANSQTVYNRLSGTITWLPSVGHVIKPGQALFKVGGEPVLLMDGTTPAYRELSASDTPGQDILQLNRNLVALGFNPDGITVDDTWQTATTVGVDAVQAALGETETGSLSLGEVVFLPGDQLISTLETTLGSTGGSSSSNASDPAPTHPAEFVSLETKPKAAKPGHTHKPGGRSKLKTLEALIALLKAEIAELRSGKNQPSSPGSSSPNAGGPSSSGSPSSSSSGSPSSSNSGSPSSSSGGGTATAILQTTSTQLIVTVDLDATKQTEAKVGERVTVEMPSGDTVDGRVTAVSPVAQSSSSSNNGNSSNNNNGSSSNDGNSSGSGSTVPVTITLSGRHAGTGLDQAAVSVNFAQARARNVLSVPVTALVATAGGGYSVQQAAAPHMLIPVTTGLFAAGYVQISGQGIYPGLRVTDSQG
jgi:hypothetical protein